MEKTKQTKRLITVRFDPEVRKKLDHIALTSDRTLAQLIRYAVTSYFETSQQCSKTVFNNNNDTNGTRHTALRIPEELHQKCETLAEKSNVTVSDVIRDAVNIWLEQYNLENLGTPTIEGEPN